MSNWTIHNAELCEWLRTYDGPRFHAVLSDPPYGLVFMGKAWDKFASPRAFQAWVTEWAELLIENVLHPGALCMFFGGSRTVHRLTCGLQDAGFEIRDQMIFWNYGSGFPKSQNISKAVDRALGAEPVRTGKTRRAGIGQTDKHNGNRAFLGNVDESEKQIPITAPATPEAQRWEGYGTALKPAYEPIVICQAPRGGATFAALALEHGSGALNIDGGRVGEEAGWSYPNGRGGKGWMERESLSKNLTTPIASTQGRWPANFALVHSEACGEACAPDCPVRELDRQSGVSQAGGNVYETPRHDSDVDFMQGTDTHAHFESYADKGGASRFFYKAKASRGERDAGLEGFEIQGAGVLDGRQDGSLGSIPKGRNPHPCVKPLDLTTYLATLLLPPVLSKPRRILIPFCGSGSEVIGAWRAGWDEIEGVELDSDYCSMTEARALHWSRVGIQQELF